MAGRGKPAKPFQLFPVKEEFPETRKMSEKFDENMAIYQFFDHLIASGYVIARRGGGQLREMKPDTVIEHELLAFRKVDKIGYYNERTRMRQMYPHIVAKYGGDSLTAEVPNPEFADQGSKAPPPKLAAQADGLDFLLRKIRGEEE